MRNKIEVFKVGELMTTTTGEYSDYCVNGLFKVLIEFDAQDKFIEWAKETNEEIDKNFCVVRDYERGRPDVGFIEWLNKSGYISDVNYRELHTGSYGDTRLS